MKRNKRLVSALTAAAVVFGTVISSGMFQFVQAADINTPDALGDITHYNGMIFDYFESECANIEGALAVGGSSKIGTSGQYDIGASASPDYSSVSMGIYENTDAYPTLLLNGLPEAGGSGSYVHAYGGSVVLNENLQTVYKVQNNQITDTTKYVSNDTINEFMNDAYHETHRLTSVVNQSYSDKAYNASVLRVSDFVGWNTIPNVFSDLSKFEPDNLNQNDLKVFVLNASDVGHVDINGPQLVSDMEQYDLIILNFPSVTSVTFSGASVMIDGTQINTSAPAATLPAENAVLEQYASKLIWSFPIAAAVQIQNCGVVGSVIAPEAYVEGDGGSVNGMLIANSFHAKDGMELHSFPLNQGVFDLTNKEAQDHSEIYGSVKLYQYTDTVLDTDIGYLMLADSEFTLYQKNAGGNWDKYLNPQNPGENPYTTNSLGYLSVSDLPEGDYYFAETRTPSGYEPVDTRFYFSIDASHQGDDAVEIWAKNNPITTDLEIKKQDADSNEPLEGAVFSLFRVVGDRLEHLGFCTSDQDGIAKLSGLSFGKYRLLEVDAPNGYVLEYGSYLEIQIGEENRELEVEYTLYDASGNELPLGNTATGLPILINEKELASSKDDNVLLTKLDSRDHETLLPDAKYELFVQDKQGKWNITGAYSTDQYGHLYITGLKEGNYKLVETKAPEGYEASENDILFQLPNDIEAGGDTLLITAYNDAKGQIEITKVNQEDPDEVLAGAELTLYYEGESNNGYQQQIVGTETTDENGVAVFDNLKPGLYRIEETGYPDGYRRTSGGVIATYRIGPQPDDGEAIYLYEETFANAPHRGVASFRKVDGDLYEPETGTGGLENAAFALQRYDFNYRDWYDFTPYGYPGNTFISGSDGTFQIERLPIGLYRLTEISSPEGYGHEENNNIIFTITQQDLNNTIPDHETIIETYRTESITIRKTDSVNEQTGLKGAEFDLYRSYSEGKYALAASGITTDEDGFIHLDGLQAGAYQIKETKAPLGYSLGNDFLQEFNIIYNDSQTALTVTPESLTFKNEKISGASIEIQKTDHDLADKMLANAVFGLYSAENANTAIQTGTTDANGMLRFDGMEEGIYYIREIKAPMGYLLGTEQYYFEVTAKGRELLITGDDFQDGIIQIGNEAKEIPPDDSSDMESSPEDENGISNTVSDGADTANTGDDINFLLIVIIVSLLAASAIVIGIILIRKKREKDE